MVVDIAIYLLSQKENEKIECFTGNRIICMKKIISLVGARPNFIKIAPIHKAFAAYSNQFKHYICHTGQHYSDNMSKVFFDDLKLPKPHFNLGIEKGTHAQQTARIMIEVEKVINQIKPDLLIVPGDVNSTLAGSLVASKMQIPIAHIEAGLRSFDMTMPEEINRILTDSISDLLFVTEQSGLDNLRNEGVNRNKIFFTGNVMIDSLVGFLDNIKRSGILDEMKLSPGNYILTTFHRPKNVDSAESLKEIILFLNKISKARKVVFPIHPRTVKNIKRFNLSDLIGEGVILTDPLGYIDFLALLKNAELIITDSGGIQEESTFLNIPCVTVRDNTERPVTCDIGTNHLAGTDLNKVYNISMKILGGDKKSGRIPELWDGNAASRIVEIITRYMQS